MKNSEQEQNQPQEASTKAFPIDIANFNSSLNSINVKLNQIIDILAVHEKALNAQCDHLGYLRNLVAMEKPAKQPLTLEALKAKFPADILEKISITENPDNYIVKPTKFLGSLTFAKVADVVRRCGGTYVSKGKESHFRINRGE